ncbi:MAG: nitroreductase family protein [Candidatus Competibacteraceae bacterium]|nr:nitroreductase family protein [Candidatus Competibacteraceae bacterium]
MWDFFETVRHRHSIRRYQADMPVETEKLHAILEMACAAPSAGDLQSYRILVVRDAARRQALRAAAENQAFIAEAPVCLAFCADPQRSAARFGERGAGLYAIQDATIAAAYAQLAVVAAGMGSTWIGYFDEARVRRALELEPDLTPIALLSLGYPAELPEPSQRRRLSEVVEMNL